MTENRSAAVEEGLRLWRKQQIEEQLKNLYQNRSQADIRSEKEWAQFSHAQMEEILEIGKLYLNREPCGSITAQSLARIQRAVQIAIGIY